MNLCNPNRKKRPKWSALKCATYTIEDGTNFIDTKECPIPENVGNAEMYNLEEMLKAGVPIGDVVSPNMNMSTLNAQDHANNVIKNLSSQLSAVDNDSNPS